MRQHFGVESTASAPAMAQQVLPPPKAAPDERLIGLVGGFLEHFGRGIRCRLRVDGAGECVLTFPDSAPAAASSSPVVAGTSLGAVGADSLGGAK